MDQEAFKRRTVQVIELTSESNALRQQLWDQEQAHQKTMQLMEEDLNIKNSLLQTLHENQRRHQTDEEMSLLQFQQQMEERQTQIEQLRSENQTLQTQVFQQQIQ